MIGLFILCLFAVLLLGFPVAFSIGGVSVIFAIIGISLGYFDLALVKTLPLRIFGIINNSALMAVPLFVMMGLLLERSSMAKDMLNVILRLTQSYKTGLGIAVVIVGMLLAANTGIVGASVVTLALLSMHGMLRSGYHPSLVSGIITSTGTLGQIIPPSIALILLGDVMSNTSQLAQRNLGIFNPEPLTIAQLFAGSVMPGLSLVAGIIIVILLLSRFNKNAISQDHADAYEEVWANMNETGKKDVGHLQAQITKPLLLDIITSLLPPLLLILSVLGSIIVGLATPTEAASIGAIGALLLVLLQGQISLNLLKEVSTQTVMMTSMVFTILIAASLFSLVFRGYQGDELVASFFLGFDSPTYAIIMVMIAIFLLGFMLDMIEIIFVVVPIVAMPLLMMGIDPVWLAVMIAVNLQTSFLTPPFGFSLFYFKGVAGKLISTRQIYMGAIPFIIMQLIMLIMLGVFPQVATWLPAVLFG